MFYLFSIHRSFYCEHVSSYIIIVNTFCGIKIHYELFKIPLQRKQNGPAITTTGNSDCQVEGQSLFTTVQISQRWRLGSGHHKRHQISQPLNVLLSWQSISEICCFQYTTVAPASLNWQIFVHFRNLRLLSKSEQLV